MRIPRKPAETQELFDKASPALNSPAHDLIYEGAIAWLSIHCHLNEEAILETATLRRRFKEVCAATNDRHQNFQVRVHRALSWYDRAVELDEATQPDGRLLYGWIAFNALYGAWDPIVSFPAKDTESYKAFVAQVLEVDQAGLVAEHVVLPTRDGQEIRTRCVTKPSDHQKILLQRLGLKLPGCLRSTDL